MTTEGMKDELASLRRRVVDLEVSERDQDQFSEQGGYAAWSQLVRDQLLIARIGQIISSTLEIDEVYNRFAQELSSLVTFDRMSINTIDQAAGVFTIKYLVGQGVEGRHIGAIRNLRGGTQTEHLLAMGHTVIQEDLSQSRQFSTDGAFLGEGLRSSIMVPLVSKAQIIGSLSLRSRMVGAFGAREQGILEQLAQQIAPAIANAELYQRTRQAEEALRLSQEAERRLAEENAVLAETGRIISSTLDIDGVYQRFCQETRKLVDFDRMSINVINKTENTFTFKYVSGLVQPGRPVPDVVPMAGSQTEYVVLTGQTLVRGDVAAAPRFRGDRNLLGSGMRSSLMTPLKSKSGIFGTLSLRSRQVGAYGPGEQAIIERLADQIAPAIENSELYARTRRAEQELREAQEAERRLAQENAVLAEAGRIISSTLDINEVYERFAHEIEKLVDFDRVMVNEIDQEAGTYTLKYYFGTTPSRFPLGSPKPLEGSMNQHVLLTGRALRQDDASRDLRFPSDQDGQEMGLRASIMVPLISKGRTIGTLSLRSCHAGVYGDREQSILMRLADFITSAIENSELYARTRRAEQELRESEQRFRYLVESAVDAFIVFNKEGELVDVNHRTCEMLGYTREELLRLTVWDLRADETEPTWYHLLEGLLPGVPVTVERVYRRKDGSTFPVENRIGMVELKGEQCLYSITRDITERKLAQQTFLNQMRDLAVADERNRLARELHDSVAQSIYSLTLFSETSRQLLGTGDGERLEHYLHRMGQTSQQALKEMRLLVHELRPLQLENEGLVGALQHRLDAVEERAGVAGRLLTRGVIHLPPRYEYELYRIAQEALNNALKHAGATAVTVRLVGDGQRIQMEIQDNGRGFDLETAGAGGGMGLVNMRHRVHEMGGDLTISSQVSQGTTVHVTVNFGDE